MKVYAVQADLAWEDKAANFARLRALIGAADPEHGSLIVLPEMFSTGFSLNLAITRQTEAREDEAFLAGIASRHRCLVLGGVISPAANGQARNEAVVLAPEGEVAARYAKIHPFSLGGEAECHAAGGELGWFEWGGFRAAPFVCYDLRFPEIFRAAAFKGASLFVVIALWPVKRQHHWLALLQARAIENQAFVVGVNRTGLEPQYSYAGRSVVINPHGIVIADAGEAERVLCASLDPEEAAAWRRDFPALRDAHWRDPAASAEK